MTTIVATFSPETFGAKNARMLNWMQWIRAGGSERCDLVTSPMFLTRQLCILDHCRFSQLECTAEDADQLSLDFLVAPHLICDAMKHSQTPSVIRQELREVFACVDTSLNAQMIFYIKEVVQTLRLHLYRRFSSFNPASDFTPAFSPAVFGWRNAYLLNCLQCVYETAARRSYFTDDFWKQTLVTRMAGTESGAEWLMAAFFGVESSASSAITFPPPPARAASTSAYGSTSGARSRARAIGATRSSSSRSRR